MFHIHSSFGRDVKEAEIDDLVAQLKSWDAQLSGASTQMKIQV
jgi:hypothetical protein